MESVTGEGVHGLLADLGRQRDPSRYRTYLPFRVGTVFGVGIHVTWLLVFSLLGIWPLALFNVGSVAWYVLLHRWNERGRFTAVIAMGILEVLAHQALCVHVIGWDSGLQYWIISVSIVPFFLPAGRNALKGALFAGSMAMFVLLAFAYGDATPVEALPPWVLKAMMGFNIVSAFVFLALLALYYGRAADVAEAALGREHRKSEALLRNILPEPIVGRLKDGPQVLADGYESATILFADIVGFTTLSARIPPQRLTALLDSVFSVFDDLVDQRGLEKIKTIGDAYMAAAGLPFPHQDHAAAAARMAQDMHRTIDRIGAQCATGLKMRIGICTGPVIAGTIGQKKFIYDLWGDTVNTASRMESHGLPGRTQVAASTYGLLRGRFEFEERGTIDIRGKGPMKAYLLLSS